MKGVRLAILGGCLLAGALLQGGCRDARAVPVSGAAVQRPAPAAAIAFEDVTARAGIRTRWGHRSSRPLTNLESFGVGCAFLDVDQDGLLDLLLISEPTVDLYRNRGGGRFEEFTGPAGLAGVKGAWKGCAVGDYDDDGWPDLFLTAYHDGLLLRNERGRFVARRDSGIRHRGWGSSAVWADLDADGRLDLFVGNYVEFGPKSIQHCTFGGGVKGGCPPRVYPAEFGVLYRNNGDGTFTDRTRAWGLADSGGKNLGVAACDYDDDGDLDLYLANDGIPGDLFRNEGGGRFTNVGVLTGTAYGAHDAAQAGMGVDWGDFNRDGRFDLIVTAFSDEVYSLYQNEGPVFRHASAATGIGGPTLKPLGFGTRLFDADNDGWLDLVFANGHVYDTAGQMDPESPYRQPMQFFRNLGGTRFEDLSRAAGPALRRPIVGRGLAAGDFDNDGRQDLLVVDYEDRPLLLRNATRGAGHFLTLRLEQPGRNRLAYGSRVWATAGGARLAADVNPGGSYLSSSDPRLHLGLGGATRVERLEIRWPDGEREVLQDLPADRFLVVRRGEGWRELPPAGEEE